MSYDPECPDCNPFCGCGWCGECTGSPFPRCSEHGYQKNGKNDAETVFAYFERQRQYEASKVQAALDLEKTPVSTEECRCGDENCPISGHMQIMFWAEFHKRHPKQAAALLYFVDHNRLNGMGAQIKSVLPGDEPDVLYHAMVEWEDGSTRIAVLPPLSGWLWEEDL